LLPVDLLVAGINILCAYNSNVSHEMHLTILGWLSNIGEFGFGEVLVQSISDEAKNEETNIGQRQSKEIGVSSSFVELVESISSPSGRIMKSVSFMELSGSCTISIGVALFSAEVFNDFWNGVSID
jgi:hypothetical protein